MSERCERTSKRANGRASGPVLKSVFFSIFDHSDMGLNMIAVYAMFSLYMKLCICTRGFID